MEDDKFLWSVKNNEMATVQEFVEKASVNSSNS
jgi:hypothetical protein